jgi:hypothetical protein
MTLKGSTNDGEEHTQRVRRICMRMPGCEEKGVVRSDDGLDLESAEPDLGVLNLESDLATR